MGAGGGRPDAVVVAVVASEEEEEVASALAEGLAGGPRIRTEPMVMTPTKSSNISMANVMRGTATAASAPAASAAGKKAGGWKVDVPIPYGLQEGTPKWSSLPPPPPSKKTTTAAIKEEGRPLSSGVAATIASASMGGAAATKMTTTSEAISMANVMKGWTRESSSGSSQSTPSDGGGGGDGSLPGLVQSRAVITAPAGPSPSSPSLLAPEGSSSDQRSASRTLMGAPGLPSMGVEDVAGISKEEQLAKKLIWLQAPVSPAPQQQQQRPQPIGQFGTSDRNTARIGSATRLGSLASFGVAVQGLDNQGGGGVPAGGAAAATSGLSPYDDEVIGRPSTGAINSGKVKTPTAVGGGGG